MKSLLLRGLTLMFAVGVLAALVVHASITSGCSKPDAPTKEPQAPSVSDAGSTVSAPTTSSASTSTSASAPGNITKPGPFKGVPLGGSKSGMVFRPQNAAPETSAR